LLPQAAVTGVSSETRLSQAEALSPAIRFVSAREEVCCAAHAALAVAVGCCPPPTVEMAHLGILYTEVSGSE
jgi:hypothetical protein